MLHPGDFCIIADDIFCFSGSEFYINRHNQFARVCRHMTQANTADFWLTRTALQDAPCADAWTVTKIAETRSAIDKGYTHIFKFGITAGPEDASLDFVFTNDCAQPIWPL
jgi:hypothetical protein